MIAPQIRQRPALAGVGREVDTAKQVAHGFYHGVSVPNAAPTPRDPASVGADLYGAAEALFALAGQFCAGVITENALSSADRLLVGTSRLILELRQRGRA